jgi:N utilization substance protein A
MTGAKVKDCIANERLVFVIEENDIGKALGKQGSKVKNLESSLKRRIKLVEFNNDVLQFVKNLAYPMELDDVKNVNGTITVSVKSSETKAMLIGREHKNINSFKEIVKRYFNINEIRVV